ncbi:MAG TPA: SAM-dependent methyltransferase, partial [Diaminobutyricibacter sp.]
MTDSVDRLRADLVAARFSVTDLGVLWGEVAAAALYRGQRIPALRAIDTYRSGPSAGLATLARVFVLG